MGRETLMGIRDKFLRWRCYKGYGVHSPLAFALLERVIRHDRKYAYYGYDLLETYPGAPEGHTRSVERARLLLRLVAFLQPSYVWTSPETPEIFKEAIRLGGGVVRLFDGKVFPDEMGNSDLILLYRDKIDSKSLKSYLGRPDRGIVGFDCNPAVIKRVRTNLKNGILLEGEESFLCVTLTRSQVHSYQILGF